MNDPGEEPEAVTADVVPRRAALNTLVFGGAAVGAGALGAFGADKLAGPGGVRRERFTFDVACLADTWREGATASAADDGDIRAPFIVEGWVYEAGTITGDGFLPTPDLSIGRWFCHGWLIITADRSEPHTISHQDFILGAITAEQVFPPDTLAVVGLEGTELRDVRSSRSVIGGTGRYAGANGVAYETFIGTNTSSFFDGAPGPSFRFDFDMRVFT